jgi:hypothetical protein
MAADSSLIGIWQRAKELFLLVGPYVHISMPRILKLIGGAFLQGTLQFNSGLLLRDPDSKMHEFSDDLESFLHVLTYMFICFTKSNFDPQQVLNYIENTFENHDPRIKGALLGSREYVTLALRFEGRNNLSRALLMISLEFQYLYLLPFTKEEIKRANKRRAWLNKAIGGGGETIQGLIHELIQTSDEQWTSKGSSVLIPLPLSEARLKLRRYVNMLRSPSSYQPLASLKNRTENQTSRTDRGTLRKDAEDRTMNRGMSSAIEPS